MLPSLDTTTGNLPAGIHEATWEELASAFATTAWRAELLAGLRAALKALRLAGCRRAYIDGSFVTAKEVPGDFDGCWEPHGVDPDLLDPVLLDFQHPRRAQKEKFRGELFIADWGADPAGTRFLEFFQIDKSTGGPKGIVAIDLVEELK